MAQIFLCTSPQFFDHNSAMECAQTIKLLLLYSLENVLSIDIFEGGGCFLKGQRSSNKLLIKNISKNGFSIFF